MVQQGNPTAGGLGGLYTLQGLASAPRYQTTNCIDLCCADQENASIERRGPIRSSSLLQLGASNGVDQVGVADTVYNCPGTSLSERTKGQVGLVGS